jgi:hypothetical protein
MAQFRLLGDEPRHVSMLPSGTLRRLEPDEVFTVPDGHADSYECQPDLYDWLDRPEDFIPRGELVAAAEQRGLSPLGHKDDLAQAIAAHDKAVKATGGLLPDQGAGAEYDPPELVMPVKKAEPSKAAAKKAAAPTSTEGSD